MLVAENQSMDTENQWRSGKTIDPDHDDLTRRFRWKSILSYALRGGMVDGGAVDWFSAAQIAGAPEPTSNAKYVAFETIYARNKCQASRTGFIGSTEDPYVEGLRLDEAMHPLTLMTVGVYRKALPPQMARRYD